MGAASSVLPESLTTVECQELASAHFAPALSRSPWLSAALAKRGRVRKRDALASCKRYKESVVLREVAADVLKRGRIGRGTEIGAERFNERADVHDCLVWCGALYPATVGPDTPPGTQRCQR